MKVSSRTAFSHFKENKTVNKELLKRKIELKSSHSHDSVH